MNGQTVYTNKNEGLKNIAQKHFEELKDNCLMDNFAVWEHETKLEWVFDSTFDAIMAANYLSNYFEYCHRF